MKILKFGGAAIKDGRSIKNIVKILQIYKDSEVVIVISAMGKTTNALEKVISCYFNSKSKLQSALQEIKKYHNSILLELFDDENHKIFSSIDKLFKDLQMFLNLNKSPNYNYVYDQIICFGELVSTKIISGYLNHKGWKNSLLDARDMIKTNNNYRRAKVDWNKTKEKIISLIKKRENIVTQGYIASDSNNFTTTLGREGSDYSAAIFGYCLNAQSVCVWKDVPGILNSDPRYFKNSILLNSLSYEEAIELSYYGASVIHPKTLQPLKRKEIPLYVKSFFKPNEKGTKVGKNLSLNPDIPCYIIRKNQILISISSLDFSYILEDNIYQIFKLFNQNKIKVNLIQNSAITFIVCVEDINDNLNNLLIDLKAKYNVNIYKKVNIYSIRNYNESAIKKIEKNKKILVKQITQKTVQMVSQE
ncbi:MAG: aspartate kinase [Flavobacteriaceae bacterium]|nr:aspartate kinase [Flavobacteriaceae bacterium]|tara:strand:+ start:1310 stop:2563 length:1254 start_codon:yes stop_codon:yes gene_type:complete